VGEVRRAEMQGRGGSQEERGIEGERERGLDGSDQLLRDYQREVVFCDPIDY
jgi:hypothetical protein